VLDAVQERHLIPINERRLVVNDGLIFLVKERLTKKDEVARSWLPNSIETIKMGGYSSELWA
jgi:hypothetical protein